MANFHGLWHKSSALRYIGDIIELKIKILGVSKNNSMKKANFKALIVKIGRSILSIMPRFLWLEQACSTPFINVRGWDRGRFSGWNDFVYNLVPSAEKNEGFPQNVPPIIFLTFNIILNDVFGQRTGLNYFSFLIFKPFCCSIPTLSNLEFTYS